MSYFNDVYLKRMNFDGETQQDRVKSRKEKEFDKLYLKKTEYQSLIYKVNEQEVNITCSLQPNKWNESNLIGNLLISTSAAAFKTGDILHIYQHIKDVEVDKIWLVLFVEENITKGYQLFKVICLDSKINITNEYGDSQYIIPVKFVSASSAFIRDTFLTVGIGYREPANNRAFVTADWDFLPKGTYFNHLNRTWELGGKDNLSIENVAYCFIQERLYTEEEPRSSEDILVGEDTNFFLNNK